MSQEQDRLQRASSEIGMLRNQNQLMAARLDMFDSIMLIFNTPPAYRNQGMSPDLIWEIEKHLKAQEKSDSLTNQS